MKDRVPRYPGRVRMTPVAGQASTFDMIRMDEPIEVGTPINKGTLLSDETIDIFGLPDTAVPDDAIKRLYLGAGKYSYIFYVKFADGTPVSGKTISGVSSVTGGSPVTDANGRAVGVYASTAPSISIDFSDYLDIDTYSSSIRSTGLVSKINITINQSKTQRTITTSGTYKMSPLLKDFDVALIGGGGGGGGWGIDRMSPVGGGGGGGGEIKNAFSLPRIDSFSITIGSYGAGVSAGNAGKGGTTSIAALSLNASGGGGGGSSSYSAGDVTIGRGGFSSNGGTGGDSGNYKNNPGKTGGNRSVYPLNDATIECSGGGGGSSGYDATGAINGGSSFGGYGWNNTNPNCHAKGIGGGGGGYRGDEGGGNGGAGAAMFRWRRKSL